MTNHYSLRELAEQLNADWQGDPAALVSEIADLQFATSSQLSFLSNKQYEPFLKTTQAGIVIVAKGVEVPPKLNIILVDNPYQAYAKLSGLFSARFTVRQGVHPAADVDPTAQIAPTAAIAANCVIGPHAVVGANTEVQAGVSIGACTHIGADCLIYPNVVLYHGVTLADRVTIHSGTVIGSDGFGYAPSADGWIKIHQLGGVRVGNDVEIGACTSIDRGAINDTIIEDGVIIDNQVHIAHNVQIGKRTAIAGCVGIAGSTRIGSGCTLGGLVAVNGHITIVDNVHLNGGTIVTKSILEAGTYSSGTPQQDVKTWRKNAVRYGQLSSWVERIKKLEQAKD